MKENTLDKLLIEINSHHYTSPWEYEYTELPNNIFRIEKIKDDLGEITRKLDYEGDIDECITRCEDKIAHYKRG